MKGNQWVFISPNHKALFERGGFRYRGGSWRIIPVSKWLVTMVSFRPLRIGFFPFQVAIHGLNGGDPNHWTKSWDDPPSRSSHKSGQIIATSRDLTPNDGLVREIPLFQGNLGEGEILWTIWPDKYNVVDLWSHENFSMCDRKGCLDPWGTKWVNNLWRDLN